MEGGPSRRQNKSSSDNSADSGYSTGSYNSLLPKESSALPTVASSLPTVQEWITLEEWLVGRDTFRVVAPGPPRQLLFRAGPCSSDIALVFRQHIEADMLEILSQKGIAVSSATIQRQWTEHQGSRDQDLNTLVIESPDTNPLTWKDAAHEILILFRNLGFESGRMEVEIFNAQLAHNNVSTTIGNDELLVQELRAIQPSILQIVQDVMGVCWSSIAFHNRRHRLNMDATPRPTVIVYIRPGSRGDFNKLDDSLTMLLKVLKSRIWLEILPGLIMEAAITGPQVIDRVLPRLPSSGSSIGVQDNIQQAGTLGGLFWLTLPNSRMKCALTCYHVTKPIDPDIERRTRRYGVLFGQQHQEGKVSVRYPASYDVNATIKAFERQKSPSLQIQMLLNQARHMANAIPYAQVMTASGKCVRNGRKMDWSLIATPNVPDSHIRNRAAPFMEHRPDGLPGDILHLIQTDADIGWIREQRVTPIKKHDWAALIGRSSGCVAGEVNELDRFVQWNDDPNLVTHELEVVGLDQPFAEPGDSGSLVTDAEQKLIGMVIARDTNSNNWGSGLVTPFADIVSHVKELTGGDLSIL